MKKMSCLSVLFILLAAAAFAQNYVHLARVNVQDNQILGGVALKSDGDIYYVTFADVNSKLVQLDGILAGGVFNDVWTTNTVSTETKITTAQRGLNDIEIDSSGNVYISGTGNAATDTILKKFGPEPTHTVLWEMGQGALTGTQEVRHNGIEILDGTTLLIGTTWGSLGFKNLSDGMNSFANVTGGSIFQRAFAINTSNNDIYAGKNGNFVDTALNLWSGGTPGAPATYAATNDLLPGIGVNTQFGVATQPVEYVPGDNQLLIADKVEHGVRIYNISGSGASTTFTEVQFLDGANPAVTNEYGGVNGVSYNEVSGKKFIVVGATIGSQWIIDVFTLAPTSEELWMQY
ncbi:MAG: hypothetical protein Kow0059_17750 [Candidatus Sumerlaeia bacterium]